MIAVVGCQRSGTTLTGQIIGAHPDAFLIDEFDGLYPWFHALSSGGESRAETTDLVARAAGKYRHDNRIQSNNGHVGLAENVSALVLKAPNLTFDEQRLAAIGMPVTIVYPVRDPRAVVASMIRLGHIDFIGNQLNLMSARPAVSERYATEIRQLSAEENPSWTRQALLWRIKSGRRADFKKTGLTVHSLSYEDLITDPCSVKSSLLSDCGLDPSRAAMMSHEVYVGYGPGGTDRTRAIDTKSLVSWREALTPNQQADILGWAEPVARRLGYV